MSECWKPVSGYEGVYEISSIGRCRRSGAARGTWVGRILKALIHHNTGYPTYSLCLDSLNKWHRAHRLVADAFLGSIPAGMHINHKNGVRADNRVENLEIVTCAENNLHAYRELGRKPIMPGLKGGRHPMAKLNEDDVVIIRELSEGGATQQRIADRFGVDRALISMIINRKIWKLVA